jgi:GDP-4-dehydro-6-deoxy-D-mannose reductase
MRVLITGVSGFVGPHLAGVCRAAGAEVFGSARRPPADDLCDQLDGFAAADLLDADAASELLRYARPDRIFHLAAQASVGASWTAPSDTITGNLNSSMHLLDAIRRQAPDAGVLIACSGEQYGPVPDERLPVREGEPLRPQNPYAVSKASVDLLAGFYADAYGLHVVRTRAFNHCGPGQEPTYVVASFAREIARAEAAGLRVATVTTGDLRPRRDFTDVRDVARAYWLAADRASPDVYNVCSGHSTPIGDILTRLAAHSELELDQRTDIKRLRKHEVMEVRGSHTKLTLTTGWEPEIPLEQTLTDTLDWWRGRMALESRR